ncbi:MAG: ATP-binding cassette domain-containing protein [Nitrospina sp.]|jgi:ABC-2 type transport system ATP-binding protein|nr:ATP-binding cassette domain-containing protein [Nitrospina sp.]MBT6718899.1 ATP-binding cassette domain-containing protein [Nitrospina sp.]
MIEVENLTRYYGTRRAINNISFQIEKGEVVGFLGPNGAGKSTTMNIISCILPASSGSAKINGFDTFEQSLEIRKIIGYLPETPPVYPDMTVAGFLKFSAGIRGVNSKKIPSAVERVIEKCSIKDVSHRIIGRLSKGYQQRVGLAQAMVHDPEILILDEPTVGLDPIQIIEIRKLIQELAAEHTIILSSHILPEITQICKRVIIINEGEIAAVDSLGGLTASLRKSERLSLTVRNSEDNLEEGLKNLVQVLSVSRGEENQFLIECELRSNLQDEIAKLALEKNWGIVELKPVPMTLEDIFLKLTLEEKEPAA